MDRTASEDVNELGEDDLAVWRRYVAGSQISSGAIGSNHRNDDFIDTSTCVKAPPTVVRAIGVTAPAYGSREYLGLTAFDDIVLNPSSGKPLPPGTVLRIVNDLRPGVK